MKKLMYAAVCLAALAACSKEQEPVQVNEPLIGKETVLATAKDFVMPGITKTVITQSGSDAPAFAWKDGDVIGIIPMNGKTVQSNYEIAEIGSNPKNAVFDGGVWALKEGKEYAAYYPFKKEALVSNESLEFSFLRQTQSANNSLEHLGAYDYMYASAVVPQSGSAQFDFEHKISLVRLQLTVPKSDTFTRVVLESSAAWFANGASLKLSDGNMTATETVKAATINLNDIAIPANGILTLWFATLPTSALNGQTLSVKIFGDEEVYAGEVTGIKTFAAGSAYSYAASLESRGKEMQYVDLGLSVKWATCNLGANSPEDYGDHYAWGETETKYTYSPDIYKFYKSEIVSEGDSHTKYEGYTKYIPSSEAETYGFKGFYDNKTVLDPEDDVANDKFGGKWRMPTLDEFIELIDNCQYDWVTYRGIDGMKFTSMIAGYTDKWIFLPAAGHRSGLDEHPYGVGSSGCYWSSSLYTSGPATAYCIGFSSDYLGLYIDNRGHGDSVRPVYDDNGTSPEYPEESEFDIITGEINAGGTKTTLSSDNFVLWSQSDSVIVTNFEKEGKFTYNLKSGSGTQSATFQAKGSPKFKDSDTLVGVFDLPALNDNNTYMWLSEQVFIENVDNLYCPMLGVRNSGNQFTFSPAGSYIFFNLTGTGKVSSIEFSADEKMSGPVIVSKEAEISLSDQSVNSIRLNCGSGIELKANEYKVFKMAVPSNEYHNIAIVVTGTEGRQLVAHSSNPLSVQKSEILSLNLGNIDISGSSEK